MTVVWAAVAVFGAVGVVALRNPLLARLAGREVLRRRGQSLLVVGGLMVGAAAITASLVAADFNERSFTGDVYRSWGRIDVTVEASGAFFPASLVDRLAADPEVRRSTDGVAGAIQAVGSVADLTRRQGEPAVTIVGFDPGRQEAFGPFVLDDGRRTLGLDLRPGEVVLSRTLSEQLRARPGDTVTVLAERKATVASPPPRLRVAGVARSEGPGALGLRPTLFAPLPVVQGLLGVEGVNRVWVSAPGDEVQGVEGSERAARAVERAARAAAPGAAVRVREAKREALESAARTTEVLRVFLLAMSLLIVAAGAALVVNLVLMLAEERRPRHGVLRALGLSRRKLVALSLLEGAIYSLGAALAGTAVGVAAGRIVAGRFASAFTQFFGGEADFEFVFAVRPVTLAVSFAGGALVTLTTVAAAARRTSRMSIPAAIRDLPEPARERRRPWARPLSIWVPGAAGLALLAASARAGPVPRFLGGALVAVAASVAVRPRLSPRAHSTATGAVLAAWAFAMAATLTDPAADAEEFFAVFVMSVLLAVFGLSILASANLEVWERGAALLGRASASLSRNLRAPLAYLARRPLRTGLTSGMFAVVVSILALFSVLLFSFRPQYERDAAGFDVRVTSTGASSITLPAGLRRDVRRTAAVPTLGYLGPLQSEQFSAQSVFVPLYRADPAAGPRQPVWVQQREERFATDREVWAALLSNPRYVVSNFLGPGQEITLLAPSGEVTYEVIAAQQGGILDGIIASPEALRPFQDLPRGVTLLVDAAPGTDVPALARRLEAALFSRGVDVRTTRDLLDEAYRANRTFFSVVDVLMRMGLVVGILALGILGLRTVVERRHVIGVLRAIGYRRRWVMAGLMAEAAVTATVGVLVGLLTGLVMGWLFVGRQSGAGGFGVDAASLGGVLAVVYVAVALVTLGPAWRASRLPPAEAVRYAE